MSIYFPLHFDAGNRGCEAIAKGTAQILGYPKEQLVGFCRDVDLDNSLGLSYIYTLLPSHNESIIQKLIRKLKFATYIWSSEKRRDYVFAQMYNGFLNRMTSHDIMFSTGGDMLCYTDNQVNYTNNYAFQKGIKTVLWGCSVGKNNLTPAKIDTLKHFSAITVRESLTWNLMKELGLRNVYLFPDPAFVLDPEECVLPKVFSFGKVVGINLSNFVGHDVSRNSIIGKNLYNMINHILKKTDYNILFIPHVLWKGQDDRIICNELNALFEKTGRTQILDITPFNYCQIRFIISKCELFIGARTHAVISAYSMCVPTLALGYSVKSRGIAADLGLPNKTVVDCLHMENEFVLVDAFDFLIANRKNVKDVLTECMPSYVMKTKEAKNVLLKIM